MIFYQEFLVFGAIPVSKKGWNFLPRVGFIVCPGLPAVLYFMRGHSLVELAEHDNSAADIMVHTMYIYVLLFFLIAD